MSLRPFLSLFAGKNAIENAELAIQYKKENNPFVVGLDLSGNPLKVST